MSRPGWHGYFMGIAYAVAARADCTRRQVGCVIVDQDNRIIATGYNGSPPGEPGCLTDGACPRGKHFPNGRPGIDPPVVCYCGHAWPCPQYAAPGSSYDTGAGACTSLHAEQNALLFARASVKGCTMYVTAVPCDGCRRMITGAGITEVHYP